MCDGSEMLYFAIDDGRGILRATWTLDEGADLVNEADYQVIEPIRKSVLSLTITSKSVHDISLSLTAS